MRKSVFLHRIILVFCALAASCAVSVAGELSAQSAAEFIRTWQPITKRLTALDTEFDPTNLLGLEQQLRQMTAADGPDSARDTVAIEFGHTDFEIWASQAIHITKVAQWAKDPPEQAELDHLVSTINADAEQSDAEKATLIADLKAAYDDAFRQKPDDADIAIIKGLLPQIEPLLWPDE